MIRIGCENMAQAVKKVLVARGRDPRDFILASLGGAGAMHACFVAESMNIPRVIVPAEAGVASAFGATAMDLRQDREAFYFSAVSEADLGQIMGLYEGLEAEALALLREDGVREEDIEIRRTAQMRYVGQTYEVETPIPSGKLTEAQLTAISESFHECHAREFGVSSDDFEPAFVSLCVAATGRMARPPAATSDAQAREPVKGSREVYFEGAWHSSPVYDGAALGEGAVAEGPCIVEYEHACAVLPPAARGTVDAFGNLIIDIQR
jgi:N-methylhydantoinase A